MIHPVQQQPNLPVLQKLDPLVLQQEPEEGQVEEHAEKNVEEPLHPCVMCLIEEANQAAVFCGHMATCEECANELLDLGRNDCPVCWKVVLFYLKVFFSNFFLV